MNCFDRRTLMVLSLTLSSGFSKSSAIAHCPARKTGAIVDYATAGKLCARTLHASYAGQESCINKIRKIYENLLNKKIYPQAASNPFSIINSFQKDKKGPRFPRQIAPTRKWTHSSCISLSRESLLYTPVHPDSRRTDSSCGLSAEALVHFL